MLVKDAIELLQKHYDPEETIVVGWWDKKDFSEDMPDQEWEIRTRNIDYNIDWSRAHENIVAYLWEEDQVLFIYNTEVAPVFLSRQ